jgi:hypothetical protein
VRRDGVTARARRRGEEHTPDVEFDGRMRRCTTDDPQYEVKSDKTGKRAMHKAEALSRV